MTFFTVQAGHVPVQPTTRGPGGSRPDGTAATADSSSAQAGYTEPPTVLRCWHCRGNHATADCFAKDYYPSPQEGYPLTATPNPIPPFVTASARAKAPPPGAPASCFGNLLPLPSVPRTPTLGAVPTQQPVATAPAVAHITSCPTQNARLETPAQTSSGATVHAVTTDNVKGQPPTPKKLGPIPPPPPRA